MALIVRKLFSSKYGKMKPGADCSEVEFSAADLKHYLAYGMIEDTDSGEKVEKPASKKPEPRSKKPAAPDETA